MTILLKATIAALALIVIHGPPAAAQYVTKKSVQSYNATPSPGAARTGRSEKVEKRGASPRGQSSERRSGSSESFATGQTHTHTQPRR
jgi:hypothetical protein